uniref:BPTI/Kunitz inhibitor domain-containing protein n=1 Tax=Steinernema glaseri TaxID=37863 RepID=A0A1I8AS14_9BILA
MAPSPRRALVALIVATLFVNVAVADDESFLAAMRNLIFGTQQQNQTQPLPEQSRKALHPGHYAVQPQLPSSENAQLGYPQPPAVYSSYASSQYSASAGGSACQLPQQIGTGPYRIPRWYFNPSRMRCELFYWSGCCGNANNFQTFQACQQVCEESPNPCAYGAARTVTQCAPGSVLTTTCNGNQFCHVGATPTTTVCCNKPERHIIFVSMLTWTDAASH